MLSVKDMCLSIDAHTNCVVFVLCFSVLLCVCVLLFLRICMMVVLGCAQGHWYWKGKLETHLPYVSTILHTLSAICVFCVSVYFFMFLCVYVLLFLRICMMVVLGCTHCLLPTKRVTDDTESVGGGRTDRKTFTEKKISIYIFFPSLSFELIKEIRHNSDSGHF